MNPKRDRRTCARFFHESPMIIEIDQTGRSFEAIMYNYGCSGIYLVSHLALRPGREINVLITNSPFFEMTTIHPAIVIWCREFRDIYQIRSYATGVKLTRPVSDFIDRSLFQVIQGGRTEKSSSTEKKAALRVVR
jgi:hypothetical protein